MFHQRAGAPGFAIRIDLLVGQNGLINRVPVDRGVFAVGQAAIEQLKEQPLGPAVVIAVTGGLLPSPVDRKAQPIELGAHLINVFVGPFAGINVAFNRGVLGRQPKGIPAHGMEHGPASHPLHPRDHIRDHVVAHMAHVQGSRGIGKHRQRVKPVVTARFGCDI